MEQFCNRKRKREENSNENNENEDLFNLNQNKKIKQFEFSYPQEPSEFSDFTSVDSRLDKNTSLNKIEKDSNSTLQSKNEQASINNNNCFLFQHPKFNKKQNQIYNLKKIELAFGEIEEQKNHSKSFTITVNIRKELLSNYPSIYSKNNSNNNSSSQESNSESNHEEYYPYEIGEIIVNQYKVSKFIFLIYVFIFR